MFFKVSGWRSTGSELTATKTPLSLVPTRSASSQDQQPAKTTIPSQKRVTQQLTTHWPLFKALRQTFANTRFAQQVRLDVANALSVDPRHPRLVSLEECPGNKVILQRFLMQPPDSTLSLVKVSEVLDEQALGQASHAQARCLEPQSGVDATPKSSPKCPKSPPRGQPRGIALPPVAGQDGV